MASLRPEGALNISKGLVEIGRVDDALDALHQVLSNRRYRQWNATMEKIAEEYVKLCLVLGKPRYAKDGLIQYRNICQPNNLQSLDGIMKQFRSLAEEKVRQTRGKLTTGADGLVDLDETESGESLLLSALSAGSAVADERAARSALRDLWDALRTILEVCRNQPALDETYHATAVMAFEFCSEFKRKNEFRRISETLRLHQQQSSFRSSVMTLPGQAGNQPVVDPLTRVLETRNAQLRVATELGLWSVAFQSAEETFALLSKKRPTQPQLISYYSSLATILKMSSNAQQNQLFHTVCVLKHAALVPVAADQAVLAVLAASVADSLTLAASELISEETEPVTDKAARLTTLTGSGSVPTKQSLMSDLIAKDLVAVASESVRSIFQLLTACDPAALNAKLPALLAALPAELRAYTPALQRYALVQITTHLQAMYSCLRFEKFAALTDAIMPLDKSIKLLGQLHRIEQVDVCVDYATHTISFGASPSVSSGVSAVKKAIDAIRSGAASIRARANEAAIVGAAESVLFDEEAFFARLDEERRKCDARRNASDIRKTAIETENVRKAQELADQLVRAEEERLEADARQRASEVTRREYEAKKREDALVKCKAVVEKMTATGGAALVAGLGDEDLVQLGVVKLEKMHKEQLQKERQDRIAKRRNESRRLEYTSRLLREAENEKIVEWSKSVFESDKSGFAQVAAEKAEEWRKAAEAKKASVSALLPFSDLLSGWKSSKVAEFDHKLAVRAEERRVRLAAKNAVRHVSNDSDAVESEVAPTSTMSRDEFKEMAKSLPSWRDTSPGEAVEDDQE